MYNQAGMQSKMKDPAKILPAVKLIQARQARTTAIEPLQINSNVFIQIMYNQTARAKMGFIP